MRPHLEYWPAPPATDWHRVLKDLCALAAAAIMVVGIGTAALVALERDLVVAVSHGERS